MAGKFILWHGGQYKKTEALDLTGTSAGTSQAPQVYANTSYSVSRDNERSSTLHVTVWGCVYRIYGYSPAGNYLWNGTGTRFPYNCYVYLEVGGVEKRLGYKPSSTNYWTTDYSDGTQYFDIEWASNEALPIYFRAAADCKLNGGGYCFQSDRPKQLIEWLPVPTYNPYTPSSIWLNPNDYTVISRVNNGSWGVHYSYNAGTNSDVPITLAVHDYNATTWGVRWEPVLRYVNGSSDGVWDYYTLNTAQGFEAGNRYRITLVSKGGEALSPSSWNPQDGLVIHTYREPYLASMSVSRTTFSPQDNPTTTFTVNGSRWSSYESNFETKLKFNGKSEWSSSNNNPTQNGTNGRGNTASITQTISATNINNSYTANERSVNSISTKLFVIRKSPTTGVTASANKDIKIQFQPTQSPNNVSMLDNNNKDVKGKTVVIQDSTTVKVSWTYPTTSGGTGVVNGYYVTVYKDSNYSQVAIAEKTIGASGTNASASVTFNTADLARGVMNYIKIIPYYTKPNGTGTIRGTTDYKNALVKPISRLGTPVIDYPKNNKTWLNNKFRILFKLPEDPDFSKLGVIEENYIYKDIQVKVTPAGKSALIFAYTNTTYNAYYSCANLKQYKKAVAFNPSLYSSLADVSSYKLQIRVRKNYNIDGASEEDTWSAWSSEVTINVGKISEFNLNRGDIIKLTHYKTPRDKSVQMREAYPFSSLPSNNVAKVAGDIVEYKNYKAIYDTVKAIQTGVNNYCTYDRADVKYNTIVNAFDSPNQPKQEIITAQKEPEDIDGRNYMNIVIQEMNKLV